MSELYQSLSHSKWDCKYHVIFVPKYRRKVLFGEIRTSLGSIFHELARQQECRIIEGHLMPDHVHMCIEIPPKYAVSSVIGYLKQLHLIQVDNATAHRAKRLMIPDNIRLVFQPPYCPEVNPIEWVWQDLKSKLRWRHWDSISELQAAISQWVNQLSDDMVLSLTKWRWIIDALCVVGI